ncbi:DUF115 domain-containing protein [Rossellomorea aquimaris]|uniref:motility associated factor glycosyltransferase family protein n=1 Tax=Rossellomorea aquimaris TaxID=189382 RepID=UPI001CD3B8DE|nr:6-hydroxymethylpterin diphosphokinase MptE-like protein [Rossellomorea aquimaris]MCA1055300.1 DUF115 domain-containing protein [Rossellomorea aquimaris]
MDKVQRKYKIETLDSKRGMISLKINGLLVHSKYDPLEEAERIVESSYKKNHLHILFGLGLGYLVDSIIDKMSEGDRLIIIEPDEEVFELALKYNKRLITSGLNINFCIGEDFTSFESLLNAGFQEYMGRFTIVETPNYQKLYPDLFKKCLEISKDQLMMEILNNNTRHMFSRKWQENYTSNLYSAFTSHNIEDLTGKMDCPIVITSGGPSLTKQLPLLKGIRDKSFIICAGSTINSLLKEGITPDLVVTVDGGEPNYNHFKDINFSDIPMAYPLIVHKGIPTLHNGKQFTFNISDHTYMNKWTNKLLQRDNGVVETGHSVANFSLDIAMKLTTGPVALIGQDLAYTNNQTHASGNKGKSGIDKEKEKQRKMYYTEGYNGEKVLTDYVFNGMQKGFEQYASSVGNHKHRLYNCTEGGVKITGFQQIPFKTFVDSYCKISKKTTLIDTLPNQNERSNKEWEHFRMEVKELVVIHEKIIKLTSKVKKIMSHIKENNFLFDTISNERLSQCENELKEYLHNEFLFYILRPVIFKVQHSNLEQDNESFEDSNKRIFNKTKLLFEGIKESTKLSHSFLLELLDKLSENEKKRDKNVT